MAKGIRVAESGSDVRGEQNKTSSNDANDNFLPYMISGIAMPYLQGATVTLERYKSAHRELDKDVNLVFTCIHEASSLLEHLDTVDRYVIMCGHEYPLHRKILNMRNHIRHDLRDNLNHESNKGRIQRSKELGIHDNLLVDLTFPAEGIQVGRTVLTINEINDFLKYSDTLFKDFLRTAQAEGRVEGIAL